MDASRKFINFQIYREFCRLFPSVLGHVNPAEMSPFLMTMRILKQFYSFGKPEVYSTLVALLQDYEPSLGAKHRARTVRYIKLLLADQSELADYLVYLLPECKKPDSPDNSVGQQSARNAHCFTASDCGEYRAPVESTVEELRGNSFSRRLVVLPPQEPVQDALGTAVRIAPAVSTAIPVAVSTMVPNSVITLGKISIPPLPKALCAPQLKQVQIQSKKKPLNAVLYNPSVLIKGSVIGETAPVVATPRSATVFDVGTFSNVAQDAASTLTRQFGLKLATQVSSVPRHDKEIAILPDNRRATLVKGPPQFQALANHSDVRITGGKLEQKIESVIKKFGKETQLYRVAAVNQSMPVSGAIFSCPPNAEAVKESTGFQDKLEYASQPVAYALGQHSLLRNRQTPSQPMFVIEKQKQNAMPAKMEASGIRIFAKCVAAEGNGPSLVSVSESSPLISLRKLVAGVGMAKTVENKPTPLSCLLSQIDSTPKLCIGGSVVKCETPNDNPTCPEIEAIVDNGEVPNMIDFGDQKLNPSLPEKLICKINDEKSENLEANGDKILNISSETEGRLSPYSDETAHSILLNDGTSDYHVSDEDQGSSGNKTFTPGIKCSSSSPGSSSVSHFHVPAPDAELELPNQESLAKKLKLEPFTDEIVHYGGNTYLARLIGTPSPPTYKSGSSFDLLRDERKGKARNGIKRKRKKQP